MTQPPAPTASPSAAFTLHGAVVSFDGHRVLDGIDLTIAQGEYVVLLGANASGKSTLMRALLGLAPLSSGNLLIDGQKPHAFRAWDRIAYVPQRLIAGTSVPVSVEEAVAAALASPRSRWAFDRRRSTNARAAAALEAVGLLDRRHERLDTLSGGQQRRVMVARALATDATTLLLDEPTAGIDGESERALAHTLADLHSNGCTVVLVTHHLGVITAPGDHVVVLGGGRVQYDGPPPPPRELLESDWHHHDEPAEPTDPPGWVRL